MKISALGFLLLTSVAMDAQQIDWNNNIKNLPVVDIRKYKKPSSTTAGIQEAWNANGPGNRYLIPAGVYHISSCITVVDPIGKGIIFQGVGYSGSYLSGLTLLINDSNTTSIFCINGSNGVGGFTGGNIVIKDMQLLGNLSGSPTDNGINCNLCLGFQVDNVFQSNAIIGINCTGCIRARISNSNINTNWLQGIKLAGGGGGGGPYEVVHNTISANCLANPSADCGGLEITNCLIAEVHSNDYEGNGMGGRSAFGTGAYGTRAYSINGFSYHDNYNERNDTGSLYMDYVKGFDAFSNYFEESGLFVTANSAHGSARDNYFTNAVNAPISVSNAVNDGTGYCQITTSGNNIQHVNNMVYLTGLGGSGCNGSGLVTISDTPTTFSVNIPFSGTYTSGGTMTQVSGLSVPLGNDIKVYGNDFSLQGGLGLGTYTSGIQLMEGLGPALACAGTIAPTNQYHHITTTICAIANITSPTNQPSGFDGKFCAIPDVAFTTTTGGNIPVASTAVVGRLLCWAHDPALNKWYPSY